MIENILVLSDFVGYFSRFRPFSPIFEGLKFLGELGRSFRYHNCDIQTGQIPTEKNNSKTEVTNLYSVQQGDQTGNSPEVGSVLGSHHGLNYIFDDILSKIKKKIQKFHLI